MVPDSLKGLSTMLVNSSLSDSGRLGKLAEEFIVRYRRGERPAIQEFVDRWPERGDEIRTRFEAMVEAEQVVKPPRPQTSPPSSDRMADFRIIGEIGRGGMGVVYEAEQLSLGRRVALKILPMTMKRDARSLERFRREARSAAQLHHTNIVPVFEVGEEGDSVFYAMQFIQGQGLNLVIDELQRLRDQSRGGGSSVDLGRSGPEGPPIDSTEAADSATEARSLDRVAQSLLAGRFLDEATGPVPPAASLTGSSASNGSAVEVGDATVAHLGSRSDPALSLCTPSSAVWPGGGQIALSESPGRRLPFFHSVAEIGRQVAGGLAYAHARGIVHRDIKPANLLLDTAGVAWIADFGLAKSGDDGLTESGDILGTLRFMAPERFRGEGDGRADIYALSVTLYEMLTLRPAFESADRLHLIEQVRNAEPPRPRSLDPMIPRDLETIVLKGMAKEPSARYATASDMSEDLRRYLAGEPIQARRIGTVERVWRWSRRNPLAAALAAAVAVMVVVVVAATAISAGREHAMRIEAVAARKEAERSLAELREARTDEATFRRAIAAEQQNFKQDTTNRDIQGSLDALHSQQGALQRRTGRKAEAIETALARRDLNPGAPDRLYQVAMDLADCLPKVDAEPDTGDLNSAGADRAADLAIDSLGRAILAGFRSDEYNTHFAVSINAHFRPLHSRPAFRSLLNALDGRVTPRGTGELMAYRGHRLHVESVAISPDGKQAISLSGDRTAQLWDLATGRLVHQPFTHPDELRGVAFSPDGHSVAIGCADGRIYLWDIENGSRLGTLGRPSGVISGVAFTPDGKTLISTSRDGKVRVWDVPSQAERFCLSGHRGEIIDLAVSRDGHRAVTAGEDETVRIWDVDSGRAIGGALTGHHGRVWSVAITPDGRRALSGGDDGCLIEWNLAEGRRLRTMWGQWATIRSIAISPDGRRVLTGGPKDHLLYWDLESGRELHRFPGTFGGGMVGVAISPDGRRAVTGSTDTIARVWTLSEDAALARDLSTLGRWGEAFDAYERAIKAEPNDITLLSERMTIAWGLGRWPALVSDHDEYLRHDPQSLLGQLNRARALLMAGDREGYRRACTAMRETIRMSTQGHSGELALASMLAPDSGIDPADAIALVTLSVERYPQIPWVHQALGLAQYRAGRDKQAVLTLVNLTHLHPDWNHLSSVWPILALAYHRIGNAAEATKWLEKTREIRILETPRFGREPIALAKPWSEVASWIDFELLAREAEATLGEARPAAR